MCSVGPNTLYSIHSLSFPYKKGKVHNLNRDCIEYSYREWYGGATGKACNVHILGGRIWYKSHRAQRLLLFVGCTDFWPFLVLALP